MKHIRIKQAVVSLFGMALCGYIWLPGHGHTTAHHNTDNNAAKPSSSSSLASAADYDVVIVGAGLSGAVLAERHAQRHHRVLIIERRNHIGGNCYDYVDEETGIRVHKYGAHLFHTNNERVWSYVNRFSEWTRWDHRVLARVGADHGENYVPVPVNIETVNRVFGLHLQGSHDMGQWLLNNTVQSETTKNSKQVALSRVGQRLYDLIFGPYTQKQWNMSADQLHAEVIGRIPVYDSFDTRYFPDKYQVLPTHGYHAFFETMLRHPNITVMLETDYFELQPQLKAKRTTYFTGPIDQFFKSEERLEYRSLRFEREVIRNHGGYAQPAAVVNYPSRDVPYTRVVEYKHMLHQKSPHTILFREYPSEEGEPYYPVPSDKNKALYRRLQARAQNASVVFVGRLANYKYFNMDEAIANALAVYDTTLAPPAAFIHIVMNVFKENIDAWVKELSHLLRERRVRWFFYNKNSAKNHSALVSFLSRGGQPAKEIRSPNVGREGHSWLKYMQAGDWGQSNFFLQGNPHDMRPPRPLLTPAEIAHTILMTRESEDFFDTLPPGRIACDPGSEWLFMPFLMPAMVQVTDRMGIDRSTLCCHYGGQFVASYGRLERAWAKWRDTIERIMLPALETENDPPMGHALERLWVSILAPNFGL